jgi:hypothetical protein
MMCGSALAIVGEKAAVATVSETDVYTVTENSAMVQVCKNLYTVGEKSPMTTV